MDADTVFPGPRGGYRVLYSNVSGGPYTLYGTTADKSLSQLKFILPGSKSIYYIVFQMRTKSHGNNKNVVDSEYSTEIKAGWKKSHIRR